MANCCGRKLHLPVFQSAYRKVHSTETSHMMIRDDILMNMNNQEVTLLVLRLTQLTALCCFGVSSPDLDSQGQH